LDGASFSMQVRGPRKRTKHVMGQIVVENVEPFSLEGMTQVVS
jgi:hypothetical protein